MVTTTTTTHNEVYFSIYRLESSRRGKEEELERADVQRCVDGILSDIGYIWQRDTFQFIDVRKDSCMASSVSLPRWLEPEVAENRVWIMGGKVHCIPKLVRPSGWQGIEGRVTLEQAMDALQNHSEETEECGRGIDGVVQRKIDVYPGYAMETMHRSPAEELVRERKEQELHGFDPDELSKRMKQFVDTMSTMHGADIVDEEIQFDPDAFLNMFREVDDASSVSEGSSFYALGSSSDDDRHTYYSRNITVNTEHR
eukprot:jgi/Picre1/28465/NNA_003869.t1